MNTLAGVLCALSAGSFVARYGPEDQWLALVGALVIGFGLLAAAMGIREDLWG